MILNEGNTYLSIKVSILCIDSLSVSSFKQKVIISQNIFNELNLISSFSLLSKYNT